MRFRVELCVSIQFGLLLARIANFLLGYNDHSNKRSTFIYYFSSVSYWVDKIRCYKNAELFFAARKSTHILISSWKSMRETVKRKETIVYLYYFLYILILAHIICKVSAFILCAMKNTYIVSLFFKDFYTPSIFLHTKQHCADIVYVSSFQTFKIKTTLQYWYK